MKKISAFIKFFYPAWRANCSAAGAHSFDGYVRKCDGFRIMGLIILALLFVFFPGCIDYSRKTKSIDAPRNCSWKGAFVEIEHKSGTMRGSDMGPRYTSAHNIHTLILGGEKALKFPLKGDPDEGDYRLQFAPDCHALAVSQDKGLHSKFVFLDSEVPFLCGHLEISSSGADFWQNVPATKEVVLQILKSSTDARYTKGTNHAIGYAYGQLHWEYGPELMGALVYAVRHADDSELRSGLLAFMSLPGEQANLHLDYIKKEFPPLLGKYDDLRRRAVDTLGQENTWLLATVLASHPDTGFQQMIARKLDEVYRQAESDKNCDRILDLTEALVLKTAHMKSGDEVTVQILSRVFQNPRCPLRTIPPTPYDYKEIWSIRGEKIRINALKGLAATRSSAATRILKETAKGTCYSYQRITQGPSDEVKKNESPGSVYGLSLDPDRILGANVGTHNREDIACYAQSLLKLMGRNGDLKK